MSAKPPPNVAKRLAWTGIIIGLANSFAWFGKFKGWWN